MSPSWRVCFAIWCTAMAGERPATAKIWFVLLTVLALAAGIGSAVLMPGETTTRTVVVSVLLAMLGLCHWVRYVIGAARQNSPANAALVPNLHRSVRITTVLAWAVSLAPCALLASALENSAALFIAMAFELTALGLAFGGRKEGAVMAPLLVSVLGFAQHFAVLRELMTGRTGLLVAAMLTLALARHGLCAVFPRAGERHWQLRRRQAQQSSYGDAVAVQRLSRASGAYRPIYAWKLRRDLQRPAERANLMLHALGPNTHRLDMLVPLTGVAVAALLAKAGYLWAGSPGWPTQLQALPSLIGAAAGMQSMSLHRFVMSMANSRREQALVRLTPAAPDALLLPRVLARRLLTIALGEWLAWSVLALGVVALFDGGWLQVRVVAALAVPSLAGIAWILRDYTRRDQGWSVGPILTVALAVVSGTALLITRAYWQPWTAVLIVMLVLAGMLLRWRYSAMAAAPVAFPAGRFG